MHGCCCWILPYLDSGVLHGCFPIIDTVVVGLIDLGEGDDILRLYEWLASNNTLYPLSCVLVAWGKSIF